MKSLSLLLSIIVGFGLSTAHAGTSDRQLSFITIEAAPWASTRSDTGEQEGAFIEIIRALEKRLDRKINITITPFARIDRELASGDHDCTILIPRPDDLVVKGIVVSYHPIGFIPRKGVSINRYEDIKPLRLSVIRGGTLTPEFDEDPDLYKEFDTDYLIGLRKVARARLDAIVGAIPTLQYLAEQEGLDSHLGEAFTVLEVPLIFQCAKNSNQLALMPQINQALESIKTDGTLERIRSQYYF